MTTTFIIALLCLVIGALLIALHKKTEALQAARDRITENETDLANFAEYKRIAQSVKAKAAKPRKAKAS